MGMKHEEIITFPSTWEEQCAARDKLKKIPHVWSTWICVRNVRLDYFSNQHREYLDFLNSLRDQHSGENKYKEQKFITEEGTEVDAIEVEDPWRAPNKPKEVDEALKLLKKIRGDCEILCVHKFRTSEPTYSPYYILITSFDPTASPQNTTKNKVIDAFYKEEGILLRENVRGVKITFEEGDAQTIHAGVPSRGYVIPGAITVFSDSKTKKGIKCCVTYVYEDYLHTRMIGDAARYREAAYKAVPPLDTILQRDYSDIWFIVGRKFAAPYSPYPHGWRSYEISIHNRSMSGLYASDSKVKRIHNSLTGKVVKKIEILKE